jgi:DNA-binding response OmpR family regulator
VLTLARAQAPANTKFILYSASDESKLRALARSSGADSYISKSIQGEDLAKKLMIIHKKPPLAALAPPPAPASTATK